MSVLTNKIPPNDYNFTEKELYGSDVTIQVTNNTTRKMLFAETVFLDGWIGEVSDQDGIEAAAVGNINVNPNRHKSINQVDVADTFAAGLNPIFFVPQTNSVVGFFQDTTAVGSVLFKAEVIGAAPAATPAYIEYKPPYQNGDFVLIT